MGIAMLHYGSCDKHIAMGASCKPSVLGGTHHVVRLLKINPRQVLGPCCLGNFVQLPHLRWWQHLILQKASCYRPLLHLRSL